MKIKMMIPLLALIAFGLFLSPLYGAAPAWQLDREHTNFYFTVDHIYAKVQGRFTDFEGEVRFAPDDPAASSMSFAIEVDSIDTGISKRDKHLLSEDFLDEGDYPTITFTSSRIAKVGENLYRVDGRLTIKGVTADISLPLSYGGERDHPFESGMKVAGFNGRLTVDRLAFKVGTGKYYEMGAVGKDVDILVTIEMLRKK